MILNISNVVVIYNLQKMVRAELENILSSIKKIKDFEINFKDAPLAKEEVISLVHPKKYIEKIFFNNPLRQNKSTTKYSSKSRSCSKESIISPLEFIAKASLISI